MATTMPATASTAAAMRRFRSEITPQCYEASVNASQGTGPIIRPARAADAARIAEIFNQGVEDRVATFETNPATAEDGVRWVAEDVVIVAEADGGPSGWAKAGPYADRHA